MRNTYSPSNQLQGGCTQRMDLWIASCSQAARHHARIGSVDFPVKKNVKSSQLQNTTCFVGLVRQLQCRRSAKSHILNVKSDTVSHHKVSGVSWSLENTPRRIGCVVSGLGFAAYGLASAEGPVNNNIDSTESAMSSTNLSHGKEVHTDYSVTGIPGDGRCLFRSVVHGAYIRSRKPIPNEDHQRRLADELRTKVADEFIKRRAETEWFVEGDFDTYVSQIRKPHVWGGEPELLMASHVLQMPITVYMHDKAAGGLIAIAEYGQEHGTEAPVQVLYHGYGHYDALQIPGEGGPRSRL